MFSEDFIVGIIIGSLFFGAIDFFGGFADELTTHDIDVAKEICANKGGIHKIDLDGVDSVVCANGKEYYIVLPEKEFLQ